MPLNRRLALGIGSLILVIFATLLATGAIPGLKKRTTKTELVVWGPDQIGRAHV